VALLTAANGKAVPTRRARIKDAVTRQVRSIDFLLWSPDSGSPK
jgi:hypothetical protein